MKAALASSLAYRPRLIVLDEPFTGLDPLVRDDLIEGLLERAEDATIFISSHDLAEIESFASHIGYLERGRLQFSEELESLSARFREVALTFPPRRRCRQTGRRTGCSPKRRPRCFASSTLASMRSARRPTLGGSFRTFKTWPSTPCRCGPSSWRWRRPGGRRRDRYPTNPPHFPEGRQIGR